MSSLALLGSLEDSGALTLTGLRLPATITGEEYEALGGLLGRMHETTRWAIGDYILRGEALFGHDAYQLQESLGISPESRGQYVRVAAAFVEERRRPELTWSHHRSVAPLPPDEQDHWLDAAVAHGWTRGEMDAQRRELPPAPEPAVVVEAVIEAARAVYLGAVLSDGVYLVDAGHMHGLGSALGLESE